MAEDIESRTAVSIKLFEDNKTPPGANEMAIVSESIMRVGLYGVRA